MTNETPQTTEQEQGEWILVRRISGTGFEGAGVQWERLGSLVLVNVDWRIGGSATSAVMRAMCDPARVYRVEAYPRVVEALERLTRAAKGQCDKVPLHPAHDETSMFQLRCAIPPADDALSAVRTLEESP